jgi:hypothetical protein
MLVRFYALDLIKIVVPKHLMVKPFVEMQTITQTPEHSPVATACVAVLAVSTPTINSLAVSA